MPPKQGKANDPNDRSNVTKQNKIGSTKDQTTRSGVRHRGVHGEQFNKEVKEALRRSTISSYNHQPPKPKPKPAMTHFAELFIPDQPQPQPQTEQTSNENYDSDTDTDRGGELDDDDIIPNADRETVPYHEGISNDNPYRQEGLRSSEFFITISTNMRQTIDSDDIKQALSKATKSLFATVGDIRKRLKIPDNFRARGKEEESDSSSDSDSDSDTELPRRKRQPLQAVDIDDLKIKNPSVQGNIEIGTSAKGGRVHWHGLLKFIHDGVVHLDPKNIKDFIDSSMTAELNTNKKVGCYVSIKAVWNKDALLDYIEKQIQKNPMAKVKYQKKLKDLRYANDVVERIEDSTLMLNANN